MYSAHLHALFENDRFFSHLSTLERELSFRTEMGLYYSYFKTIATASSFTEGLQQILNDNHTEYPSTINTLKRFNLYPEVVLGGLFRVWTTVLSFQGSSGMECYQISRGFGQPPVEACVGLGDHASFYVSCVFALNGLMLGFIFVLGTYLSDSIAGGFLSSVLFFFNHGEATRVMWTPPLRESFAMPFFVLQLLAITHCLRQQCPTRVHYGLVAVFSLAVLLPWQFSQFVLVTQCFSLLIIHSLRLLSPSILSNICLSLSAALLANILLQFCNSLLLFSLLPSSLLSFSVVLHCHRLYNRLPWKTLRIVMELVSAVVLMATFKAVLAGTFGGRDDAHIGAILLSKLSSYQDFHTQLYTCSAEFDFLPLDYLLQVSATLLLPAALFVMVKVAVLTFQHVFSSASTGQAASEIAGQVSTTPGQAASVGQEQAISFLQAPPLLAVQVYYVFQCVAFAILALLIMRLKLFLTPHLCLLAAFLAGPKLQQWLSPRALVTVLLAVGAVKGSYNLWYQHSIVGEFNDLPLTELVEWASGPSLPHAVFAGAMPTMAALRLSTPHPVVNHPHYEDASLRARTRSIYSIYSRQPPSQIHKQLSQLLVTHVVVEEPWCRKRYQPGCSFAEVWDHEDPDNRERPQFCELIHTTMPDQFKLVFANNIYKVLQLL